ncbi:C40 family peptidase [Streptomyces sp. NBC_00237]|uniref:NlpC/P60 family protein n=1 Tax=Streptomyces sp. NBC_00237 TaxID=2975687 RepID=UPI002257381B|nr:NlpC/P60 family protein [Streptomyces sp. NBC_00237]MCX5207157.1 C40 family peptidase [Streptomyces sp. NBC_00237]
MHHRTRHPPRAATLVAVGVLALAATPLTLAQVTAAASTTARAAAPSDCDVLAPGASAAAQRAVRAACTQLGTWYSWGGGHGPQPGPTYGQVDPTDPDSSQDPYRRGFDCSGFVRWAYAQATGQDLLNGNAHGQYGSGRVSARFDAAQGLGPLLPGDLVVWGSARKIHHIAVYLGAGKMVEAKESGTKIMVSDVRLGGDYFGAVRIGAEPGQGGNHSTWGTDVWTHAEPSTTSRRVHRFAGPTQVRIECQKHAQSVTAEGITNDAWSYLPDHKAWITNIYLKGPAWLDGVPTCP